MTINKKILKEVCKITLVDIVMTSPYLKENSTFEQQMYLLNKVKNFTYEESISKILNNGKILTEDKIRDFEGKFSKLLKYSLSAIAGNAAKIALFPGSSTSTGVLLGLSILYSYRKLTDPCFKKCYKIIHPTKKKVCKYECQIDITKKIVNDLRKEMNKCNSTPNPKKCEKSISKEFYKWSKKLQELMVRYRQVEARVKS